MPSVYVALCLLLSFLFEVSLDWSLPVGLWITWLLMRLFIKTKSMSQAGEPNQHFALQTFFPERAKDYVDYTTNLCYSVANACGVITALQALSNPIEIRAKEPSKKEDSPKPKAKKAADLSRKKALKMLDEEIEKKSGFAKMLDAAKSMIQSKGISDKQLP